MSAANPGAWPAVAVVINWSIQSLNHSGKPYRLFSVLGGNAFEWVPDPIISALLILQREGGWIREKKNREKKFGPLKLSLGVINFFLGLLPWSSHWTARAPFL
jgi:hypothetical protein